MKKFMEGVVEWKTYAAMMFAGTIILYTAISFILGERSVPISAIAYLLVLSAIGTFIQFLAFTDRIIKKMRYTARMAIFAIPFFAVLASVAYFFEWFPMDAMHWLVFAGIYLTVFAVMAIGFEIYYRAMGKKYDGLLGQYRRQKESEHQGK